MPEIIEGTKIDTVLTEEAKQFLNELHRRFDSTRINLLEKRVARQSHLNQGVLPDFKKETASIRQDPNWKVTETPPDLQQRWVEITGPVERKMMINALNSGADVFMADFEDSLSPTWSNVIEGQINLMDTVKSTISYVNPEGKNYTLKEKISTLMVRPRGWHLLEKHYHVEQTPISASLFDFGLYFFHNAKALLSKGTGPYFYLPKLENSEEAKLWNDVFKFSEEYLKIPSQSIKVTVLIETILAAFEMEEILYELKSYIIGLNAGRWDYIFSIIKKFSSRSQFLFPNRGEVTMTTPFMRAYTTLLIQTCHKRGAHAMGGMAAFIPNRKDAELNAMAIGKVEEDKNREVEDGFDGTWVAHPDLVPIARVIFEKKLNKKPHQKNKLDLQKKISRDDLIQFSIKGGKITSEGVLQNIRVTLQYLFYWLNGMGAVAINNLMEDTATAEISRAQLWQWIHHHGKTSPENKPILLEKIKEQIQKEADVFKNSHPQNLRQIQIVQKLLTELVEREVFTDFLTIEAYQYLINEN